MSKEQENLRDKFEEETNLKCWSEPHFEDVGFSDKYVEWLEKQLLYTMLQGKADSQNAITKTTNGKVTEMVVT